MGFLSGGGFLGGAISGVTGGIFGDRAADRMGEAQHSANKLNKRQWNYIKGETAPFVSGGRNAYDKLLQSFGAQGGTWAGVAPNFDFLTQSPDYQFALQQGGQALDRSAAAKGRLYSGAQLQAQQGFGQGLASQQLGNYRSGLAGAAGMGMNALNTLNSANQFYTGNAIAGKQALGDIRASRQIGFGNALGGIAGYGANNLLNQSSYRPQGLMEANAQWGAATGENPYG